MGQTRPVLSNNISDPNTEAILNIAAVCPLTRSLGPGRRAVVWVQGCAFHCPGCIAPDWIPIHPARLVTPEALVEELLANPTITGLTFSGGEPMLQAAGLARLARLAKARLDLNIICFTGYRLEHLLQNPPVPGVSELIHEVDVLIDGPYVQHSNDNHGLRGSSNQRIHYLTERLREFDLEGQPRKVEIHLQDGQAMLVGVPPARIGEAFNQAVTRVNQEGLGLVRYERI